MMTETSNRNRNSLLMTRLALLVPSMEDIRRRTPIIAPLVAQWALSAASALALWPLVSSTLATEQVGPFSVLFWAVVVLAPVLAFAKASLMAVVLWAVLILANADRRFWLLCSVLLYGEAILASQGTVMALVLRITKGTAISSPEELRSGMGLAALVPSSQPELMALAGNFTLVHVAWFLFLCVAFRRAVELKRLPAAALAAVCWIAIIATAVARSFIA